MRKPLSFVALLLVIAVVCSGCQMVDQQKVEDFNAALESSTMSTADIQRAIDDYDALNDAEKEAVGADVLTALQDALAASQAVDDAIKTSQFSQLEGLFDNAGTFPAGVRNRCLEVLNDKALSLVYVSSTDVIDRPEDAESMAVIADTMSLLDTDVAYTQYISLYNECADIVFDNRDTIEQASAGMACLDLFDALDRLTDISYIFDYGPGYTYFRSPESRELFLQNAQELKDIDISAMPSEYRGDIAMFISDYFMSAQALTNAIDQENADSILSALTSQQAALLDLQDITQRFLEPVLNLITELDVSVNSMRQRYASLLLEQ